jgi:hypothetical protein
MDIGELVVRIEAKIDGLEKNINKAGKVVDDLSKKTTKAGGIISNTLSFAGGLGIVTALENAGSALINVGKRGIMLASDLQEVQNVVDTTFKQGAGIINAWSKTTMNAFGLSELQAKQFSGTMGAMLTSTGLAGDQVNTMSMKLTELTGDMSSFYNLPHQVVWDKIRAGISGETEPLKQLGINMSSANLEAFALSQGINKSWTEMSQAEQATLRYNFILNATKDAQGDFTKTQTGFANQLRIIKNNFDQIVLSIAVKLLPSLTKFANFISGSMPRIQTMTTKAFNGIKNAIGFLKDNADILLPVVTGLTTAILAQSVISSVTKLYKAWQLATVAQTTAQWLLNIAMDANPIGLVAAAIGLLVAAGVVLYRNWDTVKAKVLELWQTLKDNPLLALVAGPIGGLIAAGIALYKNWDVVKLKTIEIWNSITNFFTVDVPNAFNKFVDFFAKLPDRVQIFLYDLFMVKIPYAIGYGIGWMIKTVSEGIPKLIQWFADLPGKIWVWLQATILKFVTWATDIKTKATETGKSILDNIISFVKNLPSNLWNLLVTAGQKLAAFLTSAKTTAKDIGKAIFDGIVDFVTSIPDKIAKIFTGILDAAKRFVKKIKDTISSVVGSVESGYEAGKSGTSPRGVPGFARGINNFRGGMAIVGERGPELLNLPRGSQVIPNKQTEAMMGQTLNFEGMFAGAIFNVRSDNDTKLIAREIYNLQTSRGRSSGVVYGT